MRRPAYESNLNIKHQDSARDQIADYLGVEIESTPRFHTYDWEVYGSAKDRPLLAVVEFKRRKKVRSKYPTLMISAGKIRRCRAAAAERGVAFWLVVQWDDVMGVWTDDGRSFEESLGGRTVATRDAKDIERVIHIPVEDFVELKLFRLED